MDFVMSGNIRHNTRVTILIAVAAGLLIGLAGFVMKTVVSGLVLGKPFLITVLTSPLSYAAAFLGLVGFILFQKALKTGRVTMITPIMNGISIVIPVIFAVLFLSESLPPLKLAGIILIVTGIIGLK